MKTNGLIYSSESKKHSSEQFLGKQQLRELFPDDHEVILEIFYIRNSYKSHKVKERKGVKSKKSKKQKFLKAWCPKIYKKSRVILL